MVKSGGGQRESEGAVVPVIGVRHNAPGGKGPHRGHAWDEGKREGLAGTARPSDPGGLSPAVLGGQAPVVDGRASFGEVRRLQRGLWAAAKQSEVRRFHALYQGGKRPLGIPAVRDRVAQRAAKIVLEPIFELRPEKTKVVDLRAGREGLDFLGCHFHARMSGRLWEQKRIVRSCLHRRPSQQAMKRLRAKVRARTGSNRAGVKDIRDVIADVNPLLRGWGNYFRTGNAAVKFRQAGRYVTWRLKRLLIKKRGRNLRAGQADQWTEEWLHGLGLHKLSGTIRYPKAA